jgi:hypothetical protein
MREPATNSDPTALVLRALAATLSEPKRAERFLALTGLDADQLRERLGDPGLLSAVIGFLENHEPDLVAVAKEIGTTPAALVTAGGSL